MKLIRCAGLFLIVLVWQLQAGAQKRVTPEDSLHYKVESHKTDSLASVLNTTKRSVNSYFKQAKHTSKVARSSFGSDSKEYLNSLFDLANAFTAKGQSRKRSRVIEKITEMTKTLSKTSEDSTTNFYNLARFLENPRERMSAYRVALQTAPQSKSWITIAEDLVDDYLQTGEFGPADSLLKIIKDSIELHGVHNYYQYPHFISERVVIYQSQGKIRQAIDSCLAFLDSNANSGGLGKNQIILRLAHIYYDNSDYASAYYQFMQYIRDCKGSFFEDYYSRADIVETCLEWPELFRLAGQSEYYKVLCDEYSRLYQDRMMGKKNMLYYYYNYYAMVDSSAKANYYRKKETKEFRKLARRYTVTNGWRDWAEVGKYHRASAMLKREMSKAKKHFGTESLDYASCLSDFGELYEERDTVKAISFYEKARILYQLLNQERASEPVANIDHQLGHLYWNRDSLKSYQYALQSLNGYEQLGYDEANYNVQLIAIDAIEHAIGFNDSVNFYKYACRLMDIWTEKFRTNVVKFEESQQEKLITDPTIGEPALHLRILVKGLLKWFHNDSAYLSKLSNALSNLYSCSLDAELDFLDARIHPDNRYFSLSRDYDQLLHIRKSLNDGEQLSFEKTFDPEYGGDEVFFKNLFTELETDQAGASQIVQFYLSSVKANIMNIVKDEINNASSRNPKYVSSYPIVQWISYQVTEDSSRYAAIITMDHVNARRFIDICSVKELDTLLQSYYNHGKGRGIRVEGKKTDSQINRQLFDLLWKPINSYVSNSKVIYNLPSGLLNKISFAALQDSEGKYNLERYQFYQLATARDVWFGYKNKPYLQSTNVILFGGIDYGAAPEVSFSDERKTLLSGYSFTYLPGTAKEVDTIASLCGSAGLKVTLFASDTATEANFDSTLSATNSGSILHIATHGFYLLGNEELLESDGMHPQKNSLNSSLGKVGFVLAGANQKLNQPMNLANNGIITAEKLYQNNDLRNIDLIVLSACETALGDVNSVQGVYGLQRAFRINGVENMIMSLWKVPDNETAEMMSLFYSNLAGGDTYYKAFSKAQLVMKEKYKDPYIWAGFVFIGNGGNVE